MERNIKVLIANETQEDTKEISEKLTNEKATVDSTANGKDAIKMLEENTYDLLITDLVLAEIDGFEVIERAKELNKNRITISKRFNILIQNNFISEVKIKNKMAYKIEQQNFFINVSKNFINDFLCLPFVTKEEEFLKTYLWLKSQFQKGKTDFSYGDLIESFGHSKGNKKVYDRFKIILNELQNQKLIILDTQKSNRNKQGQFTKTFKILGINEN